MGAWIWRKLLPHLAYPALCVEDRADPARCPDFRTVTVTDCVDHLVAETNRSGFGKIVLVGHSGAGCLIPLAASRSGKRVRHLVFISANIPPQGRRTVDVMPLFTKWAHLFYAGRLKRSPVPEMPPGKKEAMVRNYFCNCCDEETIRFVCDQALKPEPPALMTEKIFRPENPGVKRTFVRLLRDNTASRVMQDRMIANLGSTDQAVIDTDHLAMLSRPRELAEVLNGIAARVAPSDEAAHY